MCSILMLFIKKYLNIYLFNYEFLLSLIRTERIEAVPCAIVLMLYSRFTYGEMEFVIPCGNRTTAPDVRRIGEETD